MPEVHTRAWYQTGGPEITRAEKTQSGGQEVSSEHLKSASAAGIALQLSTKTTTRRLLQSTMEGTRTSLWLFVLLSQLPFCPTDAGQGFSAMQTTNTYKTPDQDGSSTAAMESSLTTVDHTNSPDTDTNGTRADCLIDTEMGLIAIGSAGGLIVFLLVATVVLACQVCHIQHRVYALQTSRSNMDLVSGTSYWGPDQPEAGGMVGPCDASVMLEEVRAESKMEEERQPEIPEVREEAGPGLEEGATVTVFDLEEASQMKSSSSRDSCLEVPRDLEDMPLVV
ncbi:uncharacterized protein LOC108900003 [Lates calcarifer]|uniref:Uncharacterized protein LOC108900003 n=1 Tax=Lates calcarifer TaxID=8187 RepID=A0AAJ8AWN3_LATCA|nr:uncharacterized protein LOC108900003 [Lates calcarifer]